MRCFTMKSIAPTRSAAAIAAGLDWLAGLPMDVVLMDLQYTTAIVKPEKIKRTQDMQSRIEAAATSRGSICFAASP